MSRIENRDTGAIVHETWCPTQQQYLGGVCTCDPDPACFVTGCENNTANRIVKGGEVAAACVQHTSRYDRILVGFSGWKP